jgi:hypothetical protein
MSLNFLPAAKLELPLMPAQLSAETATRPIRERRTRTDSLWLCFAIALVCTTVLGAGLWLAGNSFPR